MPEPLAHLAAVSGFDLYVSATFDSPLFRAVKEARSAAEVRIYVLKRPVEDIAPAGLSAPVVFQMFGRMNGTGDCALSEEDILQFIQNLLNDDHPSASSTSWLAATSCFSAVTFPAGWAASCAAS